MTRFDRLIHCMIWIAVAIAILGSVAVRAHG
jgi:hypothetical protein